VFDEIKSVYILVYSRHGHGAGVWLHFSDPDPDINFWKKMEPEPDLNFWEKAGLRARSDMNGMVYIECM